MWSLLLVVACTPKAGVPLDSPGEGPGLAARPANPTCLAPARPTTGASVTTERAFPALDFVAPLAMAQLPGDGSRWYVAEQGGTVWVFDADDAVTTATVAVSIADRISNWSGNEDGLLGLAFHPDFAVNGELFLSYTTGGSRDMRSRVSRFTSSDGGGTFDPDSEEVLLDFEQPYTNHNGGQILFGPDGYLYAGYGDGGSGGDPRGNGQDTSSLLGKMLRIDVDGGDPYGIPAGNPFADGEGGLPEIWAWGLRNPWRFTFDRATGDLWAGDVGQDEWEEVDLVEAGGNYGWNVKEGTHCYAEDPCEGPYVDPVVEYSHREGDSVTGGYVYRGSAIPELVGTYLYADAYGGTVWGLFWDEVTGEPVPVELLQTGTYPVSFGEGEDGEVYFTDWGGGAIHRFVRAGEAPAVDFPATLSATGCMDPADPSKPGPGLVPYGVNAPLWSDGAEKERWFAIPDGTTIDLHPTGTLDLPVGSVVVKQFRLGGSPVETRLLVRHDDGNWAGYTYRWRADGGDADLLAAGERDTVAGQEWSWPSRPECLECHTPVADRLLGLTLPQLERDQDYTSAGGGVGDQLETLAAIGMFTEPPGEVEPLPDPFGDAPVADRARAYLDSNCAMCHQPGGTGGGPQDLRYPTAFADTALCDVEPLNGDLGVEGAVLLAPGEPERSILSLRLQALDVHRMPPLASAVVHAEGVALVDAWIAGIAGCP